MFTQFASPSQHAHASLAKQVSVKVSDTVSVRVCSEGGGGGGGGGGGNIQN